jgi:hypothetical protein
MFKGAPWQRLIKTWERLVVKRMLETLTTAFMGVLEITGSPP